MKNWRRGDFVEWDGLLAVVVGIEGEPNVPEGHVGLWFGDPHGIRKSEGGEGSRRAEVWTVPAEFCLPAADPAWHH